MEKLSTYRAASLGFRQVVTLYPEKLTVAGYQFGTEFKCHCPLRDLSPSIGWIRIRNRLCPSGFCIFMFFVVLCAVLIILFELPFDSPGILLTAGLAVLSLCVGIVYFPKTKYYRVVNHSGHVIVDVVESGPEKHRCREFVDAIAAAIVAARTPKW